MRVVMILLVAALGCQKSSEDKKKTDLPSAKLAEQAKRPKIPQVDPPLDIKNPPADAVRTPSGLIYKSLTANPQGQAPKKNDTVMIKYTGWRQASGETFFSNKSADQPMPLNLASTAPGFTEGMQMVKKGERGVLWLPPSIGLKEQPKDGTTAETLVYEVEVVDIKEAPAIPPDVAQPPATAKTTKSGVKYVEVRAGTGKEKPTAADDVTFNFTAWNAEGRMLETTEMKNKPVATPPFRQPAPIEEVLMTMTAGQRVRFWVDAEKMKKPGPMFQGQLCYEIDLVTIQKSKHPPPPTPPDVAKPPGDAKKSEKGVFYKVLKAGKGGPKPTAGDSVRVHYSGWQTDGRMFDSSVIRGEPSEFSLRGVIAGWTEGIPLMSVGDKFRFWIPDHLAYKGQPDRPQGMLVFDVELLEIKAPPPPDAHGGHGH